MSYTTQMTDNTTEPIDIDAMCRTMLAWANSQPGAGSRLLAVVHVIERLRHWSSREQAGVLRTQAARALYDEGWSHAQIAEMCGISRSRAKQWIEGTY